MTEINAASIQPEAMIARTNVTVGQASADRTARLDRSGADVPSVTDFSFGDVLDLLNPLQHIPLVSAAYRAVTGEDIHPAARVAGDVLYGGAIGAASSILSGAGGALNSAMQEETGHDAVGQVVTAMLGDTASSADEAQPSMAEADSPATSPTATATTAPVRIADLPPLTGPSAASESSASSAPSASSTTLAASTKTEAPVTGFAIPRDKMPFGGVMAPLGSERAITAAMTHSAPAPRMGNTIYTGRLMNGPHPLPVASSAMARVASTPSSSALPSIASTATTASAPLAATSTSIPSSPVLKDGLVTPVVNTASAETAGLTQPAAATAAAAPVASSYPTALSADDVLILKAIGQYRSVAEAPSSTGTTVNVVN